MQPATVGELEELLFEAFPREDAEAWDQPGLSVGDRSARIAKVAVALDQNVEAVLEAAEAGCNVLVTHHPPFIKGGPVEFGPAAQVQTTGPGRMVYEAARRGVNLIAMHTNADRAIATRDAFARQLGCTCDGNFEFLLDARREQFGTGFGAILLPDWEARPSLRLVAQVCLKAFGGDPRVWGDPERTVNRIAFLNGSWNEPELYDVCVRDGIDCMVVGETRYHGCIDAQPYLSIVELGHDRSELALVDVIEQAIIEGGVDAERVVKLACSGRNWWTPGTER